MTDLNQIMVFANSYRNLGTAVQEQVTDLMSGGFDDVNPAAVKMIKSYLGGKNEELDAIICEYYEYIKQENI